MLAYGYVPKRRDERRCELVRPRSDGEPIFSPLFSSLEAIFDPVARLPQKFLDRCNLYKYRKLDKKAPNGERPTIFNLLRWFTDHNEWPNCIR